MRILRYDFFARFPWRILPVFRAILPAAGVVLSSALVHAGKLETILVEASADGHASTSETQHRLSQSDIDQINPQLAYDIILNLPSANVTTNSRGEALVSLRSAGERQTVIFFAGAPINVPWDNRYDLSSFPAAVVSSAATATGALSPRYGANALASVALQPKSTLASDWQVELSAGSQGQQGISVLSQVSGSNTNSVFAVSHVQRDGLALASDHDLSYYQASDSVRTNTDLEQSNVYAHHTVNWQSVEGSVTLVHTEGERGVAPESDRPDGNRFWRYPKADNTMLIANGVWHTSDHSELNTSVWWQDFQQTIDSFTDAEYSQVEQRQRDRDQTAGLRTSFDWGGETFEGLLSGSLTRSQHRQKEDDFISGANTLEHYQQQTATMGFETQFKLGSGLWLEAGLGWDYVDYTDAGEHEPLDAFFEPVYRLGARWQLAEHSQTRLAIGEKHRFPTMRELYGTAVNRFLINPELQPEKSRSLELGYEYNLEPLNFVVTAFYQQLENTIDQRRVDGLRQRINLRGTDIYGLELVGQWQLSSHWALHAQSTVMNASRIRNNADEPRELSERPEVLARLKARYQVLPTLAAVMEYERRGHSYSPDPEGDLRKLSGADLLHFGFDWVLPQSWSKSLELSARINNVTDEFYEFQSGLPAAGREFRLSVTWQK